MERCNVRSGSPVRSLAVPECPPLPPQYGGCPRSAFARCGQYARSPAQENRCPPMLPHFTLALEKRTGGCDSCCPCCGQELPAELMPCPATMPGCPARENQYQYQNQNQNENHNLYRNQNKNQNQSQYYSQFPPDARCQMAEPLCPSSASVPTCPPAPSRDNRGALRPDMRDCPALGLNFCTHDPAQPFTVAQGYCNYPSDFLLKSTRECDVVKPRGLLRVATALGPPQSEVAAERCPATDSCCARTPFGADDRGGPSCCERACVPPDAPDTDVARRVGGFRQNMPSPCTWI